MATTVNNNPFDTQQPSGSQGIIGGAIQTGSQDAAAQYTAQQREVSRPTETTSGQLESLLSKDSPLMQRARTLAMQGMNRRGLINSSMAQGAGVSAMIDAATPIAQSDAQTYSNRALANMQAVNEGGMFNVGEQNKFGLQKGEQAFTAGENVLNRQFQTSERLGGEAFTAEQNRLTQNFNAAQAELDRALQVSLADKSIEATSALERARQNFQSAEAALDRANQTAMQDRQFAFTGTESQLDREQQTALQQSQQVFQGTQAQLDRTQQVALQQAQQTFQGTQAELDRAQQIMLADKTITATAALEQSRQEFQRGEAVLDRAQQSDLQQAAQTFQASQADQDRAQQIMLADKQISATQALEQVRQEFQAEQAGLDRNQARELAQAARDFQGSQADLDRAQQIMLADKNISAQQALQQAQQEFARGENALDRQQQSTLQKSQQDFQATQAQLDRTQQSDMIKLQNNLAQSNVSSTFAANITSSTSSSINALLADPNLSAEAKRVAVQNVIDNANSTLQWASTFYNTDIAGISAPGQSSANLTPGGTAPPGGLPGGTTMTPGQSNDPLWEQVLKENYDAHVAQYGVDWNTSRTSDAERSNALASMRAEYERRKQGLVGGAMAG